MKNASDSIIIEKLLFDYYVQSSILLIDFAGMRATSPLLLQKIIMKVKP